MWSFPITRRSAVIIIVSVVMNYLLFLFTSALNLPIRLDDTGTVYSALLLGPVAGVVVGVVQALILAGFYYGWAGGLNLIVSVVLALIAGIAGRRGEPRGFLSALGLMTLGYFALLFIASLPLLIPECCGGLSLCVPFAEIVSRHWFNVSFPGYFTMPMISAMAMTLLAAFAVIITSGVPPQPVPERQSAVKAGKGKKKKKKKKKDRKQKAAKSDGETVSVPLSPETQTTEVH